MTAIGKILVFFVLILSLIWNALVVNAYVTRTNYKNALDKAEKQLVLAADAANYERKRADESRAASDATVAQLNKEIVRLQTSEATYKLNSENFAKQVADNEADKDKRNTDEQTRTANVNTLTSQVELLRKSVTQLDKDLNDSVISREKALNDKLQADIDRDGALRRAEERENQLLTANDQLNTIKSGVGATGIRIPQTDPGLQAKVKSVSGDQVEISLGSNAKLQKGAVLQVWRYLPEAKFVGSITITSVDPFSAVGRFIPRAGVSRPTADDLPKADDTVGVLK